MAVYYKKIKGRNYDGKLIDLAKSLVKGKGDGRISLSDAKTILRKVKDSDEYTDIEKNTMRYIRDNYSFTPDANEWFRTEIRKWAAIKSPKTPPKPASKSVKKRTPTRPKTVKKDTQADFFEEIYQREHAELLKRAGIEEKPKAGGGGKKVLVGILIVLALCVLIAIGLFLSPETKERFKEYLGISPRAATQMKVAEIKEGKEPVKKEEEKIAAPIVTKKLPVKAEENAQYYTVQVKDDLVSISEKLLKDYSKWKEIYEANRDVIKNPYVIYPGQKLKIPGWESKK